MMRPIFHTTHSNHGINLLSQGLLRFFGHSQAKHSEKGGEPAFLAVILYL